MGGGPESPKLEGKKHDLLLCVLPWPEPKESLKKIQRQYPKLEIKYIHVPHANRGWKPAEGVPGELYKRANILATLSILPPSASEAPNLSLVHIFSAGINNIVNHPIYTDSKIPLTTSSGIHGPQIAEWVIMTTLIQSHKYNDTYEGQKRHDWGNYGAGKGVRDMVGQRVGVLGYGSIGRQVARVANALGMDVIAYTASPRSTPDSKKDKGFIVPGTGDPDGTIPSAWYSGLDKESLHGFLQQEIDLLVISVPLTKQTTHLLSTPEFDLLARSNPNLTYVANISRGAIINQEALVSALYAKKLRGAALDVTDPEPLPPDSSLWSAPNVLITPHISGNSVNYVERAFQVLEENLKRREEGKDLVNEVDRKRGY
ncbi:hypothetical protein K432DRAFT_378327 [Lepidopterella palustris CBS 459.81]|uniref:D-isomer specific 2-hydroxyacid dehydrogenase NAD-binding domain-containing protein n=1 Tax=Lepidopterella palustris CBS 459.81 TaxID=1314670 RepID=A0A8E2JJF1_9PEZI|nr:hypothetical protein K432DRAFT_378327 [Lepidopterella palustris CBS 459.81]